MHFHVQSELAAMCVFSLYAHLSCFPSLEALDSHLQEISVPRAKLHTCRGSIHAHIIAVPLHLLPVGVVIDLKGRGMY